MTMICFIGWNLGHSPAWKWSVSWWTVGASPAWLWSVFLSGLWVLPQRDCDLFSWWTMCPSPAWPWSVFSGGLWVLPTSFPSMTMKWPWACFLVWTMGSSPVWQWVSLYGWTVFFQAWLCKVCLCDSAVCDYILTQHDCVDRLIVLGMNVLVD